MKTLILIISLSFMFACGVSDTFSIGYATNHVSNINNANEKAQIILKRRGYKLDKVSDNIVRTKWRYIKFYPNTNLETWFVWQIEVKFYTNHVVTKGWCLQQKTKRLEKRLFWNKCTNPTILDLVSGSVNSLQSSL